MKVAELIDSSTSDSDEAYSGASGASGSEIICCVLPCAAAWVRLRNVCQAGAESGFWYNG